MLKDYYVLTPWHSKDDKSGFTAYSFFDAEVERGVLLLFRMENCSEDRLTVRLPYAEDGIGYKLTDEDSEAILLIPGKELREAGCVFVLPERRSARMVWIEVR